MANKTWRDKTTKAEQEFVQQLAEQMDGSVAGLFENLLNKLSKPSQEEQKELEKLTALESGGVDNWDFYGDSLEDWRDKWEPEDEEEEEDEDFEDEDGCPNDDP